MNIKRLIPFLAFAAFINCEKNNSEPSDGNPDSIPDIPINQNASILKCDADIVASSNSFGFSMLNEINANTESDKNIFISPSSISIAFALAANGANGETRNEIITTLGFQNKEIKQIDEHFMNFTKSISTLDPQAELSFANSVWPADWLTVKQDFTDASINYFDAETIITDFTDANANKTINTWVEDKTNDRIKDLLEPLTSLTAMVIVNAIYFKADWSVEFEEKNTTDAQFYHQDGTSSSVDMMYRKGDVNYYQDENLQAVELFYGDSTFSMVVMLPKANNTTDDLISSLNDTKWNKINGAFNSMELDLYLPRTKINWKDELNDYLQTLGIIKAFYDADFSNITASTGLYISKVVHQSFLEVNEQGSEAAAATAIVIIEKTAIMPYFKFKADKPFVLAIKENNTNSILFIGEINNPVE